MTWVASAYCSIYFTPPMKISYNMLVRPQLSTKEFQHNQPPTLRYEKFIKPRAYEYREAQTNTITTPHTNNQIILSKKAMANVH